MREGVVPTADNGYDKFEDVRGESGTRVTIRLNQRAIDTGFLNEDRLKPFFAKILESSEYTVAFSTDPDAPDIIDASKREDETVLAALDTGERIDLLEATSELSIDPVSNGLSTLYFAVLVLASFLTFRTNPSLCLFSQTDPTERDTTPSRNAPNTFRFDSA